MPSVQKRRGLFPAAYNAGGEFKEEVSTELGLTEQAKVSKAKYKKKK
ncbi:hypothetical protein JCM39194_23290 [Desulfotomaculum varum]